MGLDEGVVSTTITTAADFVKVIIDITWQGVQGLIMRQAVAGLCLAL